MITFVLDKTALDLLYQWTDDNIDLAIRFCDNISPKFKSGKLIIYKQIEEWAENRVEMRYRTDLNKSAFFLIPFREKHSIRFSIKRNDNPMHRYTVVSDYELICSFYSKLADIFIFLNAFILYGSYTSKAKKAFEKKTLLDFDKDTFFTIRQIDHTLYLDTYKEPDDK